jgi:hypothetical protein
VAVAVAAIPENVLAGAVAVLIGVLGAVGLILDAARQRRDSNDLILGLMEHGRITPPSVLRAESTASGLADQESLPSRTSRRPKAPSEPSMPELTASGTCFSIHPPRSSSET